jgi:acyl-CoA synthetase (AMP-forming)/AMP-acid ligase II
VAQYLYNCPEYLESMYAAWKAGLVPVNTNYRYADDELVYLWDNADAVAVVFHGAFTEHIERIRDRVPGCACGSGSTTAAVPAPRGPRPTRTPPPRTPAGGGPLGSQTATTSTCSTPAAPPACPRA